MMTIQMNRSKKAIILLASLPFICGLCMFFFATLGISEPYLSPLPLQIVPSLPKVIGYNCGDSETFIFSRNYDTNLPFSTVKEYYRKQMSFYCSNSNDINLSCDESYCFSASCKLRFQFSYMRFNYANSVPTNVWLFIDVLPSSKNAIQVTQRQIVDTLVSGASFTCPD